MQAVILAGGLGTRLMPITKNIPKSMASVLGKPYLEYQVNWLRSNGIKKILMLTGYLGENIREYFLDGGSFGVDIGYSQELEPMGTGGGLRLSKDKLEDNFILIYGDSFLPLDFSKLIKYFNDINKKGVVAVYDNSSRDSGVPENIQLGKEGIVLKYEKGGTDKDLNFVEAGVMVLKKEIVELIPDTKHVSLEKEVFPVLIRDRELAGYVSREIFYDIGTKERLKVFEDAVKSGIFNRDNL